MHSAVPCDAVLTCKRTVKKEEKQAEPGTGSSLQYDADTVPLMGINSCSIIHR